MLLLRITLFLLTFTGVALLLPASTTASTGFSQHRSDAQATINSYKPVLLSINNLVVENAQPVLQRTKPKASFYARFSGNTTVITNEIASSFLYLKYSKTVALKLARFSIAFLFHAFP